MIRNKKGFTMIEMMVTATIIVIVAAIAMPSFLSSFPRSNLKRAARELRSYMQLARINSIRDSLSWDIQFNSSAKNYTIAKKNETVAGKIITVNLSNYGGVTYGTSQGRSNGNPVPSNGFSTFSEIGGLPTLEFNSDGTSSAGYVYLKNANGDTFELGVPLSSTGKIQVKSNYGSGWTP